MSTTEQTGKMKLPRRFDDLVRLMPPRAIMDDVHYENTLDMIDRLMAGGKLSKDQAHRPLFSSQLDSLKHLLAENGMKASDLAKLLGVHVSMGSKILKGERSLTIEHLKKLAKRFRVRPELFID